MTDPVISQFTIFIYTILTGVLAGFLFDVYGGIAQVWRFRKAGIFWGDILYWIILTVLTYALLIDYNQGEVRFYVLLGLVTGVLIYFQLSRYRVRVGVVKLINLLIRFFQLIGWSIAWLFMIVLFPLRLAFIVLTFPFRLVSLVLSEVGNITINLMKSLLPASAKSFRMTSWWKSIVNILKLKK